MNEKLLCRCTSSIVADNVANALDVNSIEYRMHDETADQRNGAYGPNPGIAFYVSEQDYQEASALADPIINRPSVRFAPFCPKCGSEDTESINRSRAATTILLISIPLFIAPVIYIYYAKEWTMLSWIAVAVFFLSIILMVVGTMMNKNYKCTRCGKRFNRMIVFILYAFFAFSHNAEAGPTVQVRDIIVIDNVEHRADKPMMFQLDSVTYFSLKDKFDFNSATYSWNFRGHVATFEINDKKLYLNKIETSAEHVDFKGLLDKYMDRKGRVFASWISGTFICGAGECLYIAPNGWDSVYEQETELTVEDGVIVSSRRYTNQTYGTVFLDDVTYKITPELDLSRIPAPKGRVTVRIDAGKFSVEGKVTEWSVDFLRGHDNLSDQVKEMIIDEVSRVFNLYDWKTYCQDGEWRWLPQNGVTCPLIFQ